MKLIKINTDHFLVVDDSEIKDYDWSRFDYSDFSEMINVITHSTQPLECNKMWTPVNGKQWMCNTMLCCGKILNPKTKPISLQEVKELIGEVDMEKKAREWFKSDEDIKQRFGFVVGYNQSLEDNKEKKYTEEDLRNAFGKGEARGYEARDCSERYNPLTGYEPKNNEMTFEEFIQSLQPKTEWEVEIVDGKLKLV